MIRANLLPRSRDTVRLLGVSLDRDALRAAGLGCVFVATAAAGAAGIEELRLFRTQGDALVAERHLAADATEREEVRRVAFDVARLEATGRRAFAFHRSGNDVASAIARLGNAIPAGVFLDALTSDRGAIRLRGASPSIDRVGETMSALGRAVPRGRVSVGDVTERETDAATAVSFTAEIDADAAASPERPHHAPPADLAR